MTSVDVFLHGHHVGILTHRSALGDATEFRLSDAYRSDPDAPVLGQIFLDEPERVWRTTHRVPPWFSNLLPEGALRTLLAEQVGVNPERELHLLAALGEDLSGAVMVRHDPTTDLLSTPLRPERVLVDPDEELRFSLAGMQLKFSIQFDARGLTIPLRGQGGRWIAKLPDPRFETVPVNEFTMLSWARASGLVVPDHHLVETAAIQKLPAEVARPGQTLIVRRFDRRDDGTSVHIEDFAQVLNVVGEHAKYHAANYETIGRILSQLCGEGCLREYIRRLVFMLLSGNADMHLKNWSLIYPDGRRAELAPAYDLVATRAFPDTSRKLGLKLSKVRNFEEIDRASFRRLAEKVEADPRAVLEWVEEARTVIRERWPDFRDHLPKGQADLIEAHMATLRI